VDFEGDTSECKLFADSARIIFVSFSLLDIERLFLFSCGGNREFLLLFDGNKFAYFILFFGKRRFKKYDPQEENLTKLEGNYRGLSATALI